MQSAGPAGESVLQASLPSCGGHATVPVGSLPAGTHFISAQVTCKSDCLLQVPRCGEATQDTSCRLLVASCSTGDGLIEPAGVRGR